MILRSRWNSSLFSVCFVLLCFVRSIVLNNYNCCWVDAHIVRVAAWVCKCATENKKGDYFHMCAPFDTHSDSIWYLSTCPANTLTHTLTHTNCWWFLSFCLLFYLISFHFLKKEEAVTAAMVNVWCYLCWHGLVTAAQVMINENEMEGKNNTKSMMHLRCFKFGKHPFRNGKDEEEDHRHYQRELNQRKKCLKKGRSQNWVMECEMYTTNSFSIRMKYGRFSETNAL